MILAAMALNVSIQASWDQERVPGRPRVIVNTRSRIARSELMFRRRRLASTKS